MEKRGRFSKTIIAFFVLFFLWTALQFLAPMFLPQGSVVDLTGITVIADNEEANSEMPFPWSAIYSTGDSRQLWGERYQRPMGELQAVEGV